MNFIKHYVLRRCGNNLIMPPEKMYVLVGSVILKLLIRTKIICGTHTVDRICSEILENVMYKNWKKMISRVWTKIFAAFEKWLRKQSFIERRYTYTILYLFVGYIPQQYYILKCESIPRMDVSLNLYGFICIMKSAN